MYIKGHKLKKNDLFILLGILLGAGLIGWAAYTTHLSSLGDPYSNRAEGASGICPITMVGGDGSGTTWFVYDCETKEQAQAAAIITLNKYQGKAMVHAWIIVMLYIATMVWFIWLVLRKRPTARRYSRYSRYSHSSDSSDFSD